MEALQAAGTRLGLPEETARALTLQTALGSAKLAHKSDVDAAELRKRVTSPGGTTEAAIRVLENGGLRQLVDKAVAGAEARARELAAGN
jgi:pyrroline-5-carboxylate reductase